MSDLVGTTITALAAGGTIIGGFAALFAYGESKRSADAADRSANASEKSNQLAATSATAASESANAAKRANSIARKSLKLQEKSFNLANNIFLDKSVPKIDLAIRVNGTFSNKKDKLGNNRSIPDGYCELVLQIDYQGVDVTINRIIIDMYHHLPKSERTGFTTTCQQSSPIYVRSNMTQAIVRTPLDEHAFRFLDTCDDISFEITFVIVSAIKPTIVKRFYDEETFDLRSSVADYRSKCNKASVAIASPQQAWNPYTG